MDSAGAIAGPGLALLLLRVLPLRGVFWCAAIPGGLSILVVSLFVRERRSTVPMPVGAGAPQPGALPAQFYYTLAAVTLFSLGNSSDMFLVLRAQDAGIAAALAPLLGLVFNVTYTAASWPAGKLSDRWPKARVAAVGYL